MNTDRIRLIKMLQDLNAISFEHIALALFEYQYANNLLYKSFADALNKSPKQVYQLTDIPFLPISFFKTHQIHTGSKQKGATIFESSGTTKDTPSKHLVADIKLYESNLLRGFSQFYGNPSDYVFLALLPSYLERKNASLVHMAQVLMSQSKYSDNGFYLEDKERLANTLQTLENRQQRTILLGVTFALLDFAEAFPQRLHHTIVMETGGMKGRKEEWTRSEVHHFLQERFSLPNIHSEYGMTELLSQAYSQSAGLFHSSNTLKIMVRDMEDPLCVTLSGRGAINIIDLANIDSCAFIATDDIGFLHANGQFEVQGRLDYSALRGCSLMVV
ncbi:MAG: acyl transferase [Bacteroidetes bacterium]|nr:acyl transferase [Bacteroidota bacterium]